ncbi:MAG: putative rane protein [Miltoncostaeaceae bacterium]|nr:putative rane protein [Miltoncostaeaceae bacterium]
MPRTLSARLALALTGVLALFPASALADGDAGSAAELHDDWMSAWIAPPAQLTVIVVLALLYGVRARRLGRRLPLWRKGCFAAGLLVMAIALCSPIDPVGEEALFSVHMLQHALLGSLAPLLMVLGVTGPVLRPLLRYHVVQRLQVLAHPLVAFPIWVASLVLWHLPPLYDLAVDNDPVHALQHTTIFTAAALLWAPVAEPLPAPEWFRTGRKLAYVALIWVVGLIFVNVLWFSGSVFYPRYEATAPIWGMSALQDQGNAGSVFMVEHMLIVLVALAVLSIRMAREGSLQQRLLEAGLDGTTVRRAVRYGRAEILARERGIATRSRPGID